MKTGLCVSLAALMLASSPAFATLDIEVFDGNVLIGSANSVTGSVVGDFSDANFASVTITANGSPVVPNADLTSDTLQASATAGFTGTHILTVDVFQTGVTGLGPTASTFTANSLIGTPGPADETTYMGGTASTLGTPLSTAHFAEGVIDGSSSGVAAAGAFTSDAQSYVVSFNAANESFAGTMQLQTDVVPGPIVGAGLPGLVAGGFLVVLARRRRSKTVN